MIQEGERNLTNADRWHGMFFYAILYQFLAVGYKRLLARRIVG